MSNGSDDRERDRDRRRIPIRIDEKKCDAPKPEMTGAELKTLGGVPTGYRLFQDVPGPSDKQIADTETVELGGGEKFYSLPLGTVGGPLDERLAQEIAELAEEFPGAALHEEGERHVHIPAVHLPQGWNRERTEIVLRIPVAYPSVATPGFEAEAELRLKNGAQPGGSGTQQIDGRQYLHFCWNPSLQGSWLSLLQATRFALDRFRQVA